MTVLSTAQQSFLADHLDGYSSVWGIESAGSAGSDRVFYRVFSPDRSQSAVLILWNSSDPDWERFFSLSAEISRFHAILPALYARDDAAGLILVEDLGCNTLHQLLAALAGKPLELYKQVIERLVEWQAIPVNQCPSLSSRAMDLDMYLWETEYFATKCVSDLLGLGSSITPAFEQERRVLAERAASYERVCLHRDFQSENIMLLNNSVRFIDYQGARLGAPWYDLASLLFDPYTAGYLTHSQRSLLSAYWHEKSGRQYAPEAFTDCALQRLMQALGAYGNLSVHKGKPRYRAFVQPALSALAAILSEDARYPHISALVSVCRERMSSIETTPCPEQP